MKDSNANLIGLLNINKSAEMTSRDVVTHVSRLLSIKKCGHAGTLDPNATGVLVLLLGGATRLAGFVQAGEKVYEAQFRFAMTSSTDDIWGECKAVDCDKPTEAQVRSKLKNFLGTILQKPPAISAVKIGGKRAYKLSRAGLEFDIAPRKVTIHELELTEFDYPNCSLRIRCSSGTYIRSIARDLGEQLNCPAVMSSLVRTRVGRFSIDQSLTLDDLSKTDIGDSILPIGLAVEQLVKYQLTELEQRELTFGRLIAGESIEPSIDSAAAFGVNGELVAVLTRHRSGHFKPKINFLPGMA